MSDLNLDGFDQFIEAKRHDWKVPGVAVALVKDGDVIFSQIGQRSTADDLPVTPQTIFAIGSSSKAFTAASVAIAVDDGKLDWDKPVQDYLPWFKMNDSFASVRMTARDLLCHRSGLPRHDLNWYNSTATREQLITRLRYLEANRDFRTYFQYQNLMYLTAGYLAGYVENMEWETLVRERIFEPLSMTHSQFSVDESQQTGNFALPYREKDGEVQLIPFRNITTIGPAGSINSNLVDMVNWVKLHLSNGKFNDQTVISESNLRQTHLPQMSIADPLWFELLGAGMINYGMGWFIMPFRDQILLHHGGNIDGFSALVSFMPSQNAGAVILTNLNGNNLPLTIAYSFYDRLLGGEGKDWHTYFKGFSDKIKAQQAEVKAQSAAQRVEGTQPSHPLDAYVGEYENPGYGVYTVTKDSAGQLIGSYNRISGMLEHYHYDIFEAVVEQLDVHMKIFFETDAKGNIGSLATQLEPLVKEIVFTRMADKSLANRAFLEPFAGKYEVMGILLTVTLRGEDQLIASIPGQGDQVLEPYQGTTFNLKGLSGFSLEFVKDASDAVIEVIITQPGATLSAKRVVSA